MAPLDPSATSRSNTYPLAVFSAQALLVAGLTAHIAQNIRRATRSLTPSTSTRTQQPVRKRHAAVFASLALLSLGAVTTFSVAFRVLSYFAWAEKGNHEAPGSLWTGWYGTGHEGVGRWRLGDWFSDVSLLGEADALAVGTTEGFFYTSQHYTGLAAVALFIGVEGRRRNISNTTIASFILVSLVGSLGYALNLFFIFILFTPIALHSEDTPKRSALFTPRPVFLFAPLVVSLGVLLSLPTLITHGTNIALLRVGYLAVPFYLAFAPQIIPASWGQQHVTKASAHRSFATTFWILGLTSFGLYWELFATIIAVNTPRERNSVYDLFKNAVSKQNDSNRFLQGLGTTAQRLKLISTHPVISTTASDDLLAVVALLAWTFLKNLDVNDMLENSLLSYFATPRVEKHVAFKEKIEDALEETETDVEVPAKTPKKRGRPKKDTVNGAGASGTGSVRRSTRRKAKSDYESDAESTFEPTAQAAEEVKQTETDGASTVEDYVSGGESTALALFLFFFGGLGQLAASVLGAEVSGDTAAV